MDLLNLVHSAKKNYLLQEAIETTVACSTMALKEEELKEQSRSPKSSWAKWKRNGIIGAAAVTGGTLLAVTGAAGAGLAGSRMARRTGDVDEFEFKAIGENHNQGWLAVDVLISVLVFKEEDFVRPWEGQHDNPDRYVLQWESKNLIAVSTAIQDWLTSSSNLYFAPQYMIHPPAILPLGSVMMLTSSLTTGLGLELIKRGAMMTVLKLALTALALPATLLAMTDLIDSRWAIAADR